MLQVVRLSLDPRGPPCLWSLPLSGQRANSANNRNDLSSPASENHFSAAFDSLSPDCIHSLRSLSFLGSAHLRNRDGGRSEVDAFLLLMYHVIAP